MTILDLPFYLYIVIAATAWLFHVAEMHLMYRPLSVMQRGWSKQQKKAFDKAVYERDRVLAFYMNTGFCQWCEEREARRHHLAKTTQGYFMTGVSHSPSACPSLCLHAHGTGPPTHSSSSSAYPC